MKKIDYYIAGTSIRSLGIYISKSSGYLGTPKPKEARAEQWHDQHGEAQSPRPLLYKPRDISLEGFVIVEGAMEAERIVDRLEALLTPSPTTGSVELRVHEGGALLHIGQVRLVDAISLRQATYGTAHEEVYNLSLKLREDEPVGRSWLVPAGQAVRLAGRVLGIVSVYWGDGSASFDLFGAIQIDRPAVAEGNRYVHITGRREDLDALTLSGGTPIK